MPSFTVERRTALPPVEAWRRLTAWEKHTATVPLTRITVLTPPPSGAGTVFVARTGPGRASFADPMRVAVWQPPTAGGGPGRCRLVKTGRVVTGWAEIAVRPDGAGSAVRWEEDLRLPWLPRAFDGLTRGAGRLVFSRVVDTLLAG
ncbi:SRPBCC family protein [Streptomyces sp. NBC_00433]